MYSVNFDWGDSTIYRDEDGQSKTLAAAKNDYKDKLKKEQGVDAVVVWV
jgi:hypothetical protein